MATRGMIRGENHVIAKKHGLLAITPARNDEVPIRMKGRIGRG